jgi:hypothetical protein
MNLETAQLIKRVLNVLTGSVGKKPHCVANECGISSRHCVRLLLCMEKAGLVTIRDDGCAVLADEIAERATVHVLSVPGNGALSDEWSSMREAVLAHEKAKDESLKGVFDAIFGGAK